MPLEEQLYLGLQKKDAFRTANSGEYVYFVFQREDALKDRRETQYEHHRTTTTRKPPAPFLTPAAGMAAEEPPPALTLTRQKDK